MPIIPTPEKCLVCSKPYYAMYDTFPLCKECFLIAEELYPLLKAYSHLKAFLHKDADPDLLAEVDRIIKELKAVIEDYADREKAKIGKGIKQF